MSPERRRLSHALLLSLLIHTLLLNLVFDGQGTGLLGLRFPWKDRRIEAPDLRLVLVPAQVAGAESAVTPIAEPLPQASVKQHVSGGPPLTPSVAPAPTSGRTAAAIVPDANLTAEAHRRSDAATGGAPAESPLRADRPGDTPPPPVPSPDVIALAPSDEANWVVPAAPATPAPVVAAAAGTSNSESAMPPLRDAGDAAPARIDQEAREPVVEPAKLDSSKQAEQRKAEQLEAARLDVARQEAARLEAERQQTIQQEAARQEAARQDAARQERRQSGTGRGTARRGTARRGSARCGSARRGATRGGAARGGAARGSTARGSTARGSTARRGTARGGTARRGTARRGTARRGTARRGTARGSTARGGRQTGSGASGDWKTAGRGGRPA